MKKYSKVMLPKTRIISRRLHAEAPYPTATVPILLRFYVYDWLALVALAILDGLLNVIHPFYRFVGQFDINNFRYPFKSNTVPSAAVPVIAVIVPFVIIFAYFIFKRDLQDLHHAILGLLFSVLITAVLTDALKDAAGRPRPDFFWRCFPDGNAIYDSVTQQVLCTGRETDIKEGHKSFPSGHTSWSFAGLGYLSLYLAGKLELLNRRGHVGKSIIVLLPLLGAALVGVSRVSDYWHHWQDVFAGGFIGMVMAILCYHQHFPWLHEPDCMHAYPFNAINCAHYDSSLQYWPSSFDASPLGEDRESYVEIPPT